MDRWWYIDFEGYHFNHRFWVKEIALLDNYALNCYNYFVQNPYLIPNLPRNETTLVQYQRHRLKWRFGDHGWLGVIAQIKKTVTCDKVFIKGLEKYLFLQKWIPNLTELHDLPSFKHLNNCLHQTCYPRHRWCAKRKVHELQYAQATKEENEDKVSVIFLNLRITLKVHTE